MDGVEDQWTIWIRRLAVFQFVASFVFAGIAGSILIVYLMWTRWWWVSVLYCVWYIWDRPAPERGGRRSKWVREWAVWKYMSAYFPAKLVKTVDLSPEKNYILGFHPHGVLSIGAFLSFASEATFFSQTFPNITSYLSVLKGHFDFPLYRDYLMCSGAVAVTKKSLTFLLGGKRGTGNLVALVVGGASEALDAHVGRYRIHVKKRKGFIKMALRTGAQLVPCLSFGETNYYSQVDNPPGSFIRMVQDGLTKVFGFSPPVFYGIGPLPFGRPITTVVGAPIEVTKIEEPSIEDIDSLQEKYMLALEQLFKEHKEKYDPDGEELKIV